MPMLWRPTPKNRTITCDVRPIPPAMVGRTARCRCHQVPAFIAPCPLLSGEVGRLAMHDRPAGQVAFLFTDLEGSTRYWERRGDVMPEVYARHDAILRSAITSNGGLVYKVIGDAFQAAFATAEGALIAAVRAQQELLVEPWPVSPAPRIRMALHTCEVDPQPDGDYRTPGLNRLGRLLVAADGGEILLSEAIARELEQRLPPDFVLRNLGEQRFRDLSPQRVYQVHAPGLATEAARLRGLSQHRENLPQQATTFVGR